jgi:hypothetical protein
MSGKVGREMLKGRARGRGRDRRIRLNLGLHYGVVIFCLALEA